MKIMRVTKCVVCSTFVGGKFKTPQLSSHVYNEMTEEQSNNIKKASSRHFQWTRFIKFLVSDIFIIIQNVILKFLVKKKTDDKRLKPVTLC